MSDTSRELLILGVEAAKIKSIDEARYYLEWLLNTDSNLDEQAEAWYWLSSITDDPTEKRSLLENVLAAFPRHPEARRDLAILEGRLRPDQLLDPRVPVQPVTVAGSVTDEELLRSKCPKCGARMAARPTTGTTHCSFCGYDATQESGEGAPRKSVGEQDWVAAIYAAKGHHWEIATERAFRCDGCGAAVLVPAGESTTVCPFCGAPYVVHAVAERELIAPTGVLPFALDAQQAFACIVRWLQSEHFAPANLSTRSTQAVARPVYLPFWTFDIDGEANWAGYEVRDELRHLERKRVSGSVPLWYDDVLVPATRSVPASILSELQFDVAGLVPYDPQVLASWPTEIYSISAADASLAAREQVLQERRTAALVATSVDLSGGGHEITLDGTELAVSTYKLALLPVWVGSYRYDGTVYQVVVNGHNGTVVGNVPRNVLGRVLNTIFG